MTLIRQCVPFRVLNSGWISHTERKFCKNLGQKFPVSFVLGFGNRNSDWFGILKIFPKISSKTPVNFDVFDLKKQQIWSKLDKFCSETDYLDQCNVDRDFRYKNEVTKWPEFSDFSKKSFGCFGFGFAKVLAFENSKFFWNIFNRSKECESQKAKKFWLTHCLRIWVPENLCISKWQ